MPFIKQSTYQAPPFLTNGHFQTIVPSVLDLEKDVEYQREVMPTPDNDVIDLDWAFCDTPSKELLIISHGLCGHTHRHYVLSMVHAFRRCNIDCLAWNFRETGKTETRIARMTINDSSEELSWVVSHAIAAGYEHIYLAGFSMGGNITMLYLGRDADRLPPEVNGGIAFCGTIDGVVCNRQLDRQLWGFYEWHFLRKLCRRMTELQKRFPHIDTTDIEKIKTFQDFDNRYTAPMFGFKDAEDYYRTSSACNWLHRLSVPTLLVNPADDPFLAGQCYPVEIAEKSEHLFLEIPEYGGHCGFITPRKQEWWPAQRARQFVLENIRPSLGLPSLELKDLKEQTA